MKNTTAFSHRPHISPKRILTVLLPAVAGLVFVVGIAFFVYVAIYYHPEKAAAEALVSDAAVLVEKRDYGWFFDGPSSENLLVFYPGAKVDETAYAPFLHRLAARGMDAYLVRMPFHLAVFGVGRAAAILEDPAFAGYTQRYAGGHSLGGTMAASFAVSYVSDRSEEIPQAEDSEVVRDPNASVNVATTEKPGLDGVILFAAYPTKKLDDSLSELCIYGSEDRVLNRQALQKGREYAPAAFTEYVIKGGNHAGFGNYGFQKGDGEASISAEDQQKETVRAVMDFISPREKASF